MPDNLHLSICRADEVIGLIKQAEQSGIPFDAVISIEHPGAETLDLTQGRAPRLAEDIDDRWRDRQLILSCYDIEGPNALGVPVPGPDIVIDALDFVHHRVPDDRPLRL